MERWRRFSRASPDRRRRVGARSADAEWALTCHRPLGQYRERERQSRHHRVSSTTFVMQWGPFGILSDSARKTTVTMNDQTIVNDGADVAERRHEGSLLCVR